MQVESTQELPVPRGAPASAAIGAPSNGPLGGEFLSFRLGAEEYGIDILKVQEIRRHEAPTRIAGLPGCVKGVVNLRGVIVPVVDLRLAMDIAEARYDDFTVLIILNVAHRVVGAIVDSVSDVIELTAAQIRPAPEFNQSLDASYILGIGTLPSAKADTDSDPAHPADAGTERLLILTDIERLMSRPGMGLIDYDSVAH